MIHTKNLLARLNRREGSLAALLAAGGAFPTPAIAFAATSGVVGSLRAFVVNGGKSMQIPSQKTFFYLNVVVLAWKN